MKMVKRCVAGGCSSTNSDGCSLYSFPKDPSLRATWIKKVQTTRAKWAATKYSVLCDKHFTEDSFEVEHSLATSFGIKTRKKLKPGAIPTIFKVSPEASQVESGASSGASSSSRKRCFSHDSSHSTGQKRLRRSAFDKRENLRVRNPLDCVGLQCCIVTSFRL